MPAPYRSIPTTPARFAAMLLVLTLALAPEVAPAEETEDSPLRTGAWAAEFELDPSYQYGIGYTGSATLAVKRHSSPGRAFRFGLNVGFNEDRQDGSDLQQIYNPPSFPYPTSTEVNLDRHTEVHSYAAFLHLIREFPVRDRVAIFGELGPSFRYNEVDYHSESVYALSPPILNSNDENRLERAVAIDFAMGFEWFFSKRISLGARYGGFVAYQWGVQAFDQSSVEVGGPGYTHDRTRFETEGVDIGTNRATVTLAAYF